MAHGIVWLSAGSTVHSMDITFLGSVVESLRVLYSEYSIYSGEMYRHLNKMPVNVLTHPKRLSSCLRCHRLTIF